MARQLDDSDSAVYLMYGLAMREVQWFEICLGGLLDANTKDLGRSGSRTERGSG